MPGTTQSTQRSWPRGLVISLVLLAAACGTLVTSMPATPTPSPTQQVLSTRLLAELIGQLELVDGCLRVQSNYVPESLLLVWPVDITATVSGETVVVTDSTLGRQATWHLGDIVSSGGGNIPSLDTALRIVGQASCPGPYFLVGDVGQSSSPTPTATSTPAPAGTATPAGAGSQPDIRKGFVFKRAPRVTLKSIANNEEINAIQPG